MTYLEQIKQYNEEEMIEFLKVHAENTIQAIKEQGFVVIDKDELRRQLRDEVTE